MSRESKLRERERDSEGDLWTFYGPRRGWLTELEFPSLNLLSLCEMKSKTLEFCEAVNLHISLSLSSLCLARSFSAINYDWNIIELVVCLSFNENFTTKAAPYERVIYSIAYICIYVSEAYPRFAYFLVIRIPSGLHQSLSPEKRRR